MRYALALGVVDSVVRRPSQFKAGRDRATSSTSEWWPVLYFLDSLVFVRDLRHPPCTKGQYIVHILRIGYFVAIAIAFSVRAISL